MAAPLITIRLRWRTQILHNISFVCRVSTLNEVRVRFAPSPTGMLHLGGLRTALFNYLFARLNGGKFILRIEDTDQERKVPGAVKNLENILQWAGLIQDEGPSKGGQYGPYIQSKRLDLYKEHVNILLQTGHCYKCFCTTKRLGLLRKSAGGQGEIPGYDNKCRYLTEAETEKNLEAKKPYTIRFKYEAVKEPWTDIVFGSMLEKRVGHVLEGDFVVMKADGYPTYHFANVVDDHLMKISHVFRGEEWSISTPKHLQMYKAFGWEPPKFAHLPLILAKGGVKLSKRHGDVSVEGYREKGYEPDALLNYLTTIGSGFTEDTAGKTLEEMVHLFSPEKLVTTSSQLQAEKLEVMNRKHLLRRLKGSDKDSLLNEARSNLHQHYQNRLEMGSRVLTDNSLERILSIYLTDQRISRLTEITDKSMEFHWIRPTTLNTDEIINMCSDCKSMMSVIIERLENIDKFEEGTVKKALKTVCKEYSLQMKDFMYILRKVISGLREGMAVADMMILLGKEETVHRLNTARDAL